MVNFDLIFNEAKPVRKPKVRAPRVPREIRQSSERSKDRRLRKYLARLDAFAKELSAAKTVERRLKLVVIMARVRHGRKVKGDSLAKVRAEFDKAPWKLLSLTDKSCIICLGRAEHRHHVVMLTNGGTNIKANLIPLCASCHGDVHPWMKAAQLEAELEQELARKLAE